MIRPVSGQFPYYSGSTPPFNLIDDQLQVTIPGSIPNTIPAWTKGVTNITGLQTDGIPQDSYKILGFSVFGQLCLMNDYTPLPNYGKYGKILCGVSGLPASIPGLAPRSTVTLPDSSKLTTLWDFASDPLPPQFVLTGPAPPSVVLPVSASLTLPTPLSLNAIQAASIGMWMLPSLIPAISQTPVQALALLNMSYIVTVDDGLPDPSGQGPI